MRTRRTVILLLAAVCSILVVDTADAAKDDTILVSIAAPFGPKGNSFSGSPAISADGRSVAFDSSATNLHPDDTDAGTDIFVRDVASNTTTLVSRAGGAAGANGNNSSFGPAISADGRFVAFESTASNLHPTDPDTTTDVFVRDLASNTITLVSRAGGASGVKGNGGSGGASISADGRFVAFVSSASNLQPDDADTAPDVFVRDLFSNTTTLASRASGASGPRATRASSRRPLSLPAAGSWRSSRPPPICTPTTPTPAKTSTSATWSPASLPL